MSAVVRRATYKLYPSRNQEAALERALALHRHLYNAALQERIDAWRLARRSISWADQCRSLTQVRADDPDYSGLGRKALAGTLRRLDRAFAAFFRRVKAGQSPGFPRFKGASRFPGMPLGFHTDGWKFADGRLRVQGVPGLIRARGRGRIVGRVLDGEVIRRENGWHLSVAVGGEGDRACGSGAAAFDLGVSTFLAVADDAGRRELIANPRHWRAAQERVNGLRRKIERQKLRSRRREATKRKLGRETARLANRRKDWQHKQAAALVARYGAVATEKLAVANMTRSAKGTVDRPGRNVPQKAGLNREILDTAPARFVSLVREKAEEAIAIFAEAPTRKLKPSQTCPCCGAVRKKALDERTHRCADCGYETDRDLAAAEVILAWLHRDLAGQELAEAA
jgi:putative transposase